MLVLIQFITNGSSTVLGNFGPGDRARVKPDMARHLVDEARCARYVEQASALPPAAPPAPSAAQASAPVAPPKPRGRRTSKPT